MKKILLLALVLIATTASSLFAADVELDRKFRFGVDYGWDNERGGEDSIGVDFAVQDVFVKNLVLGANMGFSEEPDTIVEDFAWDPELEQGRLVERDIGAELYLTAKVGYVVWPITFLVGGGFSGYEEEVYELEVNGPIYRQDTDTDHHFKASAYGGVQIQLWQALLTANYDTRRGPYVGIGGVF